MRSLTRYCSCEGVKVTGEEFEEVSRKGRRRRSDAKILNICNKTSSANIVKERKKRPKRVIVWGPQKWNVWSKFVDGPKARTSHRSHFLPGRPTLRPTLLKPRESKHALGEICSCLGVSCKGMSRRRLRFALHPTEVPLCRPSRARLASWRPWGTNRPSRPGQGQGAKTGAPNPWAKNWAASDPLGGSAATAPGPEA